ncbi:YpbS family protein [Microbacteriaceae bacterium 4G12]
MEVHKAITAHSKKQNAIVNEFLTLEAQREAAIEAAVSLCSKGQPFSTVAINEATAKINELAKQGIAPVRKHVTEEMVQDYVARLQQK